MFSSPIEEIKNRLDIVEVVSGYIKLQKTGINFRAACPFHSEKKPSFFVSPARQMWHCFGGCSEGGDIFKFVMKIEGVEFGDALRILAQRAGVELKKQSPEYVQFKTERQRLYEICELAARFFEKQLAESSMGQEAKKYLLDRGITKESIEKWRLGYSPDTWQGLSDFLTSRSYQKEEITRAGLAVENDSRDTYDRFRGRIIFPIFDLNSQPVGFGGRVFKERDKEEVAKYVNTPNTLIYDKSRLLYGLDKAKMAIRKAGFCVLVEGYTDAIMAHQAGTINAAATSGTALTNYQLSILKRYVENLTLGFDMDVAGDSATKRGIDLAQAQGFNIKILRLPEGKDAAEIILKNQKEWQEALLSPKSIFEFYFESAFRGRDEKSPEGKKEISKILLPALKRIPNQIEKSFWVQKLADGLGVKETDVLEELKKTKSENNYFYSEPEAAAVPKKSRKELLEERLFSLVIKSPEKINLISEDKICFLSPIAKEILDCLKTNSTPSDKIKDYFNCLSLKAEIDGEEEKDSGSEIRLCLKEIETLETKSKLNGISREIKKAEEEKDIQKVNELTKRFSDAVGQLINL